jgi:hypothetical protein
MASPKAWCLAVLRDAHPEHVAVAADADQQMDRTGVSPRRNGREYDGDDRAITSGAINRHGRLRAQEFTVGHLNAVQQQVVVVALAREHVIEACEQARAGCRRDVVTCRFMHQRDQAEGKARHRGEDPCRAQHPARRRSRHFGAWP